MNKNFDYIVVGAGSSGSVVASRLSERSDLKIALLESGGPDTSVFLKMPLAYRTIRSNLMFDWGYETDPEPFADQRVVPAARGKVLGGSSSVNGMMYSRGHPGDYDQWAQMGARGWSYEEVLPYFRKSERNWRGSSEVHGDSGPMNVAPSTSDEPIASAVLSAARALKCRVVDDFDAGDPEGFGLPDRTTTPGRRASASKAFLDPARRRANLEIFTDAHAARILVENGRAVGVQFVRKGQVHEIRAEREVILCGGAYGSPQLLMLSGIGPADHLRQSGITPIMDLPGVGQHLQEHPLVPMGFSVRKELKFGARLRADRIALSAAYWMLTGRGFAASQPLVGLGYYKSRPGIDRPDLESIFLPTHLNAQVWFPGVRKKVPDMLTSFNVVLRPGSRGFVKLRSSDPMDRPRIQFNLLQDPNDLALMRHAVRWTREFVRQADLADHVGEAVFPASSVQSDSELDAFIRQMVVTAQHPTSTCRMGNDADAVVDPELRVRGVNGLRVADASVMPTLIGGHTNAPSIMIGEKAADLILAA